MKTNEHSAGWDEQVLPFQLDAANIRGRVARLDTLLDNVLKQHDYPTQVSALVAEAVMLTALIGQTMLILELDNHAVLKHCLKAYLNAQHDLGYLLHPIEMAILVHPNPHYVH